MKSRLKWWAGDNTAAAYRERPHDTNLSTDIATPTDEQVNHTSVAVGGVLEQLDPGDLAARADVTGGLQRAVALIGTDIRRD